MNQKIIPWIFVVWFGVLLAVQVIVVPGLFSNLFTKFIPFLAELHTILLSFLYKPYIF